MKLLHLVWIAVLAASPATVSGALAGTTGSHTILLSDVVRGDRNPFLVFQGETMLLARGSSPQGKNGVTSASKKNIKKPKKKASSTEKKSKQKKKKKEKKEKKAGNCEKKKKKKKKKRKKKGKEKKNASAKFCDANGYCNLKGLPESPECDPEGWQKI